MEVVKAISFIPRQCNEYEIWAPVKGYENWYKISSLGRLFDIINGFFCVSFRHEDEKYLYYPQINEYIHIAMMRAFNYFPGCENYSVAHKDNCTFANYLNNLAWSEQYIDPKYAGNRGSNSYLSTYTEEDIIKVCELLQENKLNAKEIAEVTGVNRSVVNGVKYGSSWKDISKNYTFDVDAKAHRTIKYPDELVENICQDLQDNVDMSLADIGRKYGVHKGVVQRISSGTVRTDISSKYDFSGRAAYADKHKAAKEQAKELLENSDLTLQEIADKCGIDKKIIYNVNYQFNIREINHTNK